MGKMNNKKRVCLVILDGWGQGKHNKSDAVFMANTPFVDSLYHSKPHASLRTDGENVGLPEGQMGNSEVGHMNIGAGRVVYQDLVRINLEIRNGNFEKNPVLNEAFFYAKQKNVAVHFIGLVSDGGVHSHINHLQALCKAAESHSLQKVFIHAFTDGRDTDPQSGKKYLSEVESFIQNSPVKVATVCGRYYAMDRDKRWERISKAYEALLSSQGHRFSSSIAAIEDSYAKNITDEFVEPSIITDATGMPIAKIREGDVVVCFNFRTDRCREITQVLTQQPNHEYNMHPIRLHFVTMTNYDDSFQDVKVMYNKDNLHNTLGEVISNSGQTQLRIAETEKYPHVTFFFSGGREALFEGENRIMVNSPKVATYDLQPEMSAFEVTEKVCAEMTNHHPDFICLNFANPDMVGHTGMYDAVIRAVEVTDQCLQKVVTAGIEQGYSFVIIADHGNADFVINEDGTPNTAHTTNPVPVFVLDRDVDAVRNGILADVAPTILRLLKLQQPVEMTGSSLVD